MANDGQVDSLQKSDILDVDEEIFGWEEWDGSVEFWKHGAAGSAAGIIEHGAIYPLDTVKTHMQALRPGSQSVPRISEVTKSILAEHGILGFTRGLSAIGGGCIPAHAALFCTYEISKKIFLSKKNDPLRAGVCGAAATLSHDLILTPCDVVKQRLQLGRYSGTLHCIKSVWSCEGVAALYRSMPTTLLMNMPYGAILVAANESLKKMCGLSGRVQRDQMQNKLPWYFFTAGIAGSLACVATQPLDVIKTRLQTQDVLFQPKSMYTISSNSANTTPAGMGGSARPVCNVVCRQFSSGVQQSPRYSGFFATASSIWIQEGFMGFCRGMVPRMLFSAPSAAMCWGTYETVKAVLC